MTPLSKCLLLPLDGAEEPLQRASFLGKLYPDRSKISIILSCLVPPLPPLYQEKLTSPEQLKKKQELLKSREEQYRLALDRAKRVLVRAGFSEGAIEEQFLERQAAKAKDACLLADRKKVDAVLVQKRFTVSLESLIASDPTHDLLQHCQVNPVWVTEGTTDVSHAAICIAAEAASLRAADHAGFMLAGTNVRVTLLHASRTISSPATSRLSLITAEVEKWLMSPEGRADKAVTLPKRMPFCSGKEWPTKTSRSPFFPVRGRLPRKFFHTAGRPASASLSSAIPLPRASGDFSRVRSPKKSSPTSRI